MRDRLIIVLLGISLGMGAKMLVGRVDLRDSNEPVQETPAAMDDESDDEAASLSDSKSSDSKSQAS